MSAACDVAVIGAGPYGLSLAAHLRERGVNFRIFGKPLDTWRAHMPKDMMLKSDGFASNLSAASSGSTLRAYCAEHRIPYANQGLPISLDTFLGYADSFRSHYVPELQDIQVTGLERNADGFVLTLEDGERVTARNVVLAVGITWFGNVPDILSALPTAVRSHSFAHRDGETFKNREVVVLGAGSSATDLAALLHDAGASVRIVARAPVIEYNSVPDPEAESLLYRLQRPASGIGRGWSSYFCATAPVLFHRLPEAIKSRAIQSHMHPAAGWFMRDRIEGRVPTLLGRELTKADMVKDRVVLTLAGKAGREEMVTCDHVIAATGYKPDMRRLPFLSRDLCDNIATSRGVPQLSEKFETRVPGLFVIGPAAIASFGPLMRFMYGAEFAAPHVATFLERRVTVPSAQRAA